MAGPMQISLEDVISMLLQRVESLSANDENSKTKSNIIYRALYKKGLITEEDILASVKEEYHMLKELGVVKEEPKDDMYQTITDGILQWIKCDVAGIKKSMTDYEQKLKDLRVEYDKMPTALKTAIGDDPLNKLKEYETKMAELLGTTTV